jgi:hypothetical protein
MRNASIQVEPDAKLMLSPSERLLLEILRHSLSDEDLAISDVSVEWTDIEGNRHQRSVTTAPKRSR